MADHPQKLGPYEIRGRVGAGGMGVVYDGWDSRLNRRVAVKTLWPEVARDPESRERFLREARAAAAVSHPNVTQIYDIGEHDGHTFFAMEFLDGKSLEDLIQEKGKLSPAQATGLIRQAAAGLKAAADRGIVHRDIKPSNLVMTQDGTVKVTDFGLAKQFTDTSLTSTGLMVGTPNYISPEQASAETTDLRSDIYSLGVTFYELVTGRPPFQGPTPVSVALMHVRDNVPSPRQFAPDLPPSVVKLLERMLAKRREGRPQDYDVLIHQLERIERESSETAARPTAGTAAHPGSGPRSRSGAHSRVSGTTVAASDGGRTNYWLPLLAAVFLAVGIWSLLGGDSDPSESEPAASGVSTVVDYGTGAPEPTTTTLPPPTILSVPSAADQSTDPASTTTGTTADRQPATGLTPRQRQRALAGSRRLTVQRRAQLKVVDSNHEITADGRLRVMGVVLNSGDGRAAGSKIRVVRTDAGGQTVDTVEAPLEPPLLGPGETARFEAFFFDPALTGGFRLELSWVS